MACTYVYLLDSYVVSPGTGLLKAGVFVPATNNDRQETDPARLYLKIPPRMSGRWVTEENSQRADEGQLTRLGSLEKKGET